MKKILYLCIIGCLTSLMSCSMGGVGRGLAIKNAGKEKIVEKNGKRPDWAISKPMYTKGGILYASGMFTDAPNLSLGLIAANKRAQANVVDSLNIHLRRIFQEASKGEQDIEHQINTISEGIVSGFFINKQFYEKKEVRGLTGIKYKYDCYALAELSNEEYLKALDGVLNGYEKKGLIDEEFHEKVEKRETEFLSKNGIMGQ